MLDYFGGIATWLSQGLNCALLKGNPDMTVSARCYLNRHRKGWRTAYRVINRLFFWQADHCRSSFRSDVVYALSILTHPDGQSESKTVGQYVVDCT